MSPDAPPRRRTRPPASTWTRTGFSSATSGVTASTVAAAGRRDAASTKRAKSVWRHHASTVETSIRPPGRRAVTSRKLASDDGVVFTMNSTSRSVKRARAHLTTERSASLTITTSDLMPAARKFPITDSINGTPAMGTIGLGTAKPAARSRLPSPAAMMPPRRGGPLTRLPSPRRWLTQGVSQEPLHVLQRVDHPVAPAAGIPGRGRRADEPDVTHPDRPRPGHVARERVADERRVGGREPERLERVEEDAGLRLRAADLRRVDEDAKERTNPRVLAHAREVAVEVGHDPEAGAAREARERGHVVAEVPERVVHEAPGDARGHLAIGEPEGLRHGGDETRHRRVEGGRRRDRPDERVVGRVEQGVEALPPDRDALVPEEPVHALLPGEPVGVERSAEVEQQCGFPGRIHP